MSGKSESKENSQKIVQWYHELKQKREQKKGVIDNVFNSRIVFNLFYYFLHLQLCSKTEYYDYLVLGVLDIFLAYQMKTTKKLKIFESAPKIFTLSSSSPILMILLTCTFLGFVVWKNYGNNNFYLIFSVVWAIFIASTSVSKTMACILVTIVMAFALNLWEDLKPNSHIGSVSIVADIKSNVPSLEQNHHAIAQDLIEKLKRLRLQLILENDESSLDKTKLQKARSSETKFDTDDETVTSEDQNATLKESQNDDDKLLCVNDIKTLIEILLAHNTSDMRVWIPRDVRNILDNEEVSAYILAYLNTQDMLPSPRNFKRASRKFFKDTLFSVQSPIEKIGDDFSFNIFSYDLEVLHKDTMVSACTCIYRKFGVVDSIGTDVQTMNTFLSEIQAHYFNNYYHNALHAADVTNSVAFYLKCGLRDIINEFEMSALLISATVHDVGHPGFNNAFMMALRTRQALIYNDQSVLENYHCSLTFQILQKEKSNIIGELTREEETAFRKIVISTILDTDLSKHFMIIKKFESSINKIDAGEEPFDLDKEPNRLIVMGVALKCGDVGHSAKSLELHKIWSRRITEEFWNQGDKEMEFNIPLTPLCDRNINIAKSQNGFLDFIALPLFTVFGKYIKSSEFQKSCIDSLKANREYWSNELANEENQGPEALTFIKDTNKYVKNLQISNFNLDDFLITKI